MKEWLEREGERERERERERGDRYKLINVTDYLYILLKFQYFL